MKVINFSCILHHHSEFISAYECVVVCVSIVNSMYLLFKNILQFFQLIS